MCHGKLSILAKDAHILFAAWASFGQLMALVGEQFDDSEDICGVVASVRRSQDKLSLWTKTATNEAAQVSFRILLVLSSSKTAICIIVSLFPKYDMKYHLKRIYQNT